MPGVHSILPNEVIYEDKVIAIGPDGEQFKGKDLNRLIRGHLLMSNENAFKIFSKSEILLREPPKELGVKTALLMNSGVKTAIALNFSEGFDKRLIRVLGGGGRTLLALTSITQVTVTSTIHSYQMSVF